METVDADANGAAAPLTEHALDVLPVCSNSVAGDPPDSSECHPMEDSDKAPTRQVDPPAPPKCPPMEDSDEAQRKQVDTPASPTRSPLEEPNEGPKKEGEPPVSPKSPPVEDLDAGPKKDVDPPVSPKCPPLEDSDEGQRKEEKEFLFKVKKAKPSAVRDFPVGCGRNAPVMTREDLPPAKSSEVEKVPVKSDGNARVAADRGGSTALKSEAKQSVPKLKAPKKADGTGSVASLKLEAKQTVQKADTVKKGDGEVDQTRLKPEVRQSVQKTNVAKKVDEEGNAAPSKLGAKQIAQKTNIVNKRDGEGDGTTTKLQERQTEQDTNNAEKEDGEEEALPAQLEGRQTEQSMDIDDKENGEGDVTAPKSEAKQTPQKARIDKNRNDKRDAMLSKSEPKQTVAKTKVAKTGDGEGDIVALNLEDKQGAEKKRIAKQGDPEGDDMLSSLEAKPSVPKKKIAKKGDGEEDAMPSKSKPKQGSSKGKGSKRATANKMPDLGSEGPDLMDSETAEMNTPGSTGPNNKKRKKTPVSRPRRSAKKQNVFRAEEGEDDASAGSDRKAVKRVLMIFDALRRRFMQEDEVSKQTGGGVKRPDLKAGTMMMEKGLWLNRDRKIIGSVPGVQSGDHFYFRMELCVIGLHGQVQAGIDYIGPKLNQWNEPVAISIIASGGYEDNEDDGGETLIYTGQGGNNYKMDKRQSDDQKLERGNLALERSQHHEVEVRVIRGIKDIGSPSGKIYIYDGLYKVQDSWLDKGKSGFGVFKYRLQRLPGQPQMGSDILKSAVKWKSEPSLREGLLLPDISTRRENFPVYLVNNVDDDKEPPEFEYITKVRYSKSAGKLEPCQGCDCKGSCPPGDKCSCFSLNGGETPYNQNGLLVRGKPLVYECGDHCRCASNCRNRVSQKGLKYHLEVFKTEDRGWGVRSWDPIPAGSFISEYVGEVAPDEEVEQLDEENEYVLFSKRIQENWTEWANVSDLLPEKTEGATSPDPPPLTFAINASNMGNVSRFINHSCSPNVFLQFVLHDHNDARFPHIMLFAMENIPALTELTFDYGSVEESEENGSSKKNKDCLCGSSDCRGKFY